MQRTAQAVSSRPRVAAGGAALIAMPTRGVFITLEGPEGAGKTTQAHLLHEALRGRYPVLHSREPGGTAIGERIRALLLDDAHAEMDPRTEMLLFAASRAQFVAEVVEPALRGGQIVLSERYVDTSIAYQGVGRGLGVELVRRVNEVATGGGGPDLCVFLGIEPAGGLERGGRKRGGVGKE